VASSTYSLEKSGKDGMALPLNKRVLLLLLAYCIQLVYVPTSNQISGGIEPKLPIDVFPIWAIWVVPYVLCYAIWFAGAIWVVLKMEDRLFRAFLIACMVTFSIGASTFVFFPTYVRQATLHGSDIFTLLLRFIHENWGRYDAFPSGHVYITTLLTLFFSRWYPRRKVLWGAILVIVMFSTLFTGQHYILDVIGGYCVALIGYHFGLWWAGFYPEQKQPRKRSDKRLTSSSLN
jgi:membrane-associated phospholipid phosphatase